MVKEKTEEIGVDYPTVAKIINCESGWNPNAKHLNQNGTMDTGLLQVNSSHWSEMEKMNISTSTWEDGLVYGLILMKREGTNPWKASESCWE